MKLFSKEKTGSAEQTAAATTPKITDVLRGLAVGEQAEFPLARMYSVRTKACELGAIDGKVFGTSMDRQAKTITVIRKA